MYIMRCPYCGINNIWNNFINKFCINIKQESKQENELNLFNLPLEDQKNNQNNNIYCENDESDEENEWDRI